MKFELSLVLRHLSTPLQKLLTLMQLSWRKLFTTCNPSIQLSQVSINQLNHRKQLVCELVWMMVWDWEEVGVEWLVGQPAVSYLAPLLG